MMPMVFGIGNAEGQRPNLFQPGIDLTCLHISKYEQRGAMTHGMARSSRPTSRAKRSGGGWLWFGRRFCNNVLRFDQGRFGKTSYPFFWMRSLRLSSARPKLKRGHEYQSRTFWQIALGWTSKGIYHAEHDWHRAWNDAIHPSIASGGGCGLDSKVCRASRSFPQRLVHGARKQSAKRPAPADDFQRTT